MSFLNASYIGPLFIKKGLMVGFSSVTSGFKIFHMCCVRLLAFDVPFERNTTVMTLLKTVSVPSSFLRACGTVHNL